MKTIKFNILLFAIILISGCNSNINNKEVLKKDSTKLIVEKSDFTKKHQLENCNCEENPELKEYISCKETVFSNGAKIYRQFNCDSSWLVFENKNLKKNIYILEKDYIEYTTRLGYLDWLEYENSILIENKVVSGCCQPLEFVLINKENGNIIEKLGKDIYIGEVNLNPFFVSLDIKKSKLNFYNLNTRKSAYVDINFKKIDITIKSRFMSYSEELFEQGSIVKGVFKIKYRYKLKENDEWKFENITIDLNKLEFNY